MNLSQGNRDIEIDISRTIYINAAGKEGLQEPPGQRLAGELF